MPVMGLVKFERLFRAAGGVSVDRDDVNRYLDFVSVALAKTFKFIDAELKAVHTEEWERTFSLFRLLI